MTHRRVLVIDDNEDMLSIMTHYLAHAGYEPLTARGAAEGARLLRESEPDVVVLEPYVFGPDRWARIGSLAGERGESGAPPLLAVTSLASEGANARQAGCADFLVKPVSPAVVLRKVETLLGVPRGSPWESAPPVGALPLHRAPVIPAAAAA
ncbi:MAG TPA: response regulator [Longimicrobium sp.]|nr:response regulator [Longimicrobium sp.]